MQNFGKVKKKKKKIEKNPEIFSIKSFSESIKEMEKNYLIYCNINGLRANMLKMFPLWPGVVALDGALSIG